MSGTAAAFARTAHALLALVAFAMPLPASAESDPTEAPYERARRTLAEARAELLENRKRAYADLPRIKYYGPAAGHEKWLAEPEVDAVLAQPITAAAQDLEALSAARDAWRAGAISLDQFYDGIYLAVRRSIERTWLAQLDLALRCEVKALGLRLQGALHLRSETEKRERESIDRRLKGTAHARAVAELQERHKQQAQEEFKRVALDYRRVKDRIKALREKWGAEQWAWVDFARVRNTYERDVHARHAYELERAADWNFNTLSSNASRLREHFFYHGDRIITQLPSATWWPKSLFPDVEFDGERGHLRMYDAVAVPYAKLRRPDREAPPPPLRAKSAGFGAAQADMPVRQAIPNALVRITATAEGAATSEHNRVLAATVTNRTTGKELKVALGPWGRPAGLFASPPIHVAPHGADAMRDLPTIEACPGEELVAQVGDRRASLEVVRSLPDDFPEVCASPPEPPRFTLTATGATQLSFDPENRAQYVEYYAAYGHLPRDPRGTAMINPPQVVFKDERGRPLADMGIAWVFPERKETLVSYTDERGVARLEFRVGERGTFTAFVDGMPSSDPIAGGVQKIFAMPTDPVLTSLLVDGPVLFQIDFVRPTILDFIDKSGGQPGALVGGHNFYVRVYLGRHDASRAANAASIQVRVDPPTWLRRPLLVEAARRTPNVYESQARTGIRTRREVTGALQPGLLVDPNDVVMASFGRAQVGIKVYDSALDLARDRLAHALAFWRDALKAARAAPQRDPARAALLSSMVENATEWLRDPNLPEGYAVAAAAAYLPLLEKERPELRPLVEPETLQLHGSRAHRVSSGLEREAVSAALAEAHREDPSRMGNRLVRTGGMFVDFVKNLPDMLFVQPVLGGYTALSGWTAEGELATTFERVMGGFEALVFVAEAPGALAGAAARGATAVRAAGRASSRAIIAEGALTGSLSLARSLAATSGSALARRAPAYVAQAAQEIALEEMLSTSRGPFQPIMTAEVEATAPATDWSRPVLMAAPKKPKMVRLQETIDRRASYAAARGGEYFDAKSRMEQLPEGSMERQRLAKRVEHLERVVAFHEAVLERAMLALGRATGRSVTLPQLKAGRPGPFTRYKDRFVHKHYEDQVTGDLNSGQPGIPVGWQTTGGSLQLPSGYQTFLSKRFEATAGNPTEFHMRKEGRKAIPDHYHPITKDVADSKYYNFEGMTYEQRKLAAAEISDTISKARLFQAEKIKQEIRDPKHPDHKPGLIGAELDEYAMQQALKRRVFIFTPERMPDDVRAMIQAHRTPGVERITYDDGKMVKAAMAGGEPLGGLVFRRIKPDVDRW